MKPSILVIGASGTVGSVLVKQLSLKGVPVRAAVHDPRKADMWKKSLNVEPVTVDMLTGKGLPRALEGIEELFLLIPASPDMAVMTRQTVDAAKSEGVKHIVKMSSLAAGPQAPYSLGRMHYATELIIEKSGIGYTFLQPNYFMQNIKNYYGASIREKGEIAYAGGNGEGSFIDVRDIASVAVKTLTEPGHEGKRYSLTGPEPLSFGRVAEVLSEALGRKVSYIALSDDDMRRQMTGAGVPDWYVEALVQLSSAFREGKLSEVTFQVQWITGAPPRTFLQYVRDHLDAFKREPAGVR